MNTKTPNSEVKKAPPLYRKQTRTNLPWQACRVTHSSLSLPLKKRRKSSRTTSAPWLCHKSPRFFRARARGKFHTRVDCSRRARVVAGIYSYIAPEGEKASLAFPRDGNVRIFKEAFHAASQVNRQAEFIDNAYVGRRARGEFIVAASPDHPR